MDRELARTLAELSAREVAGALGVRSRVPRALIETAFRVPSARLGRTLARFDARTGRVGIGRAARETLDAFGARLEIEGALASSGGVLVVTNHPGAYDALSVMASLGRDDVAFVAADRPFLRALPHVARHLVFMDERSAMARAASMRRACEHLGRGGVVVQYGAGAIEPDALFSDEDVLSEWGAGTGVLAARAASVVPVFVSGVHSPRAKRLAIVRWAERRGTTTVAPLLQATVPGFRDVVVSVRIGTPIDLGAASDARERTAIIREAVARLRGTPRRNRPTSEETEHTRARSSRARHGAQSSA